MNADIDSDVTIASLNYSKLAFEIESEICSNEKIYILNQLPLFLLFLDFIFIQY